MSNNMSSGGILSKNSLSLNDEQETFAAPSLCIRDPHLFRTYHVHNFYRLEYADNRTLQATCLLNFHLVSGNLRRECLPDGNWSGIEPVCVVDYLKDKWTLSAIIFLISFVLPVLWLGKDFYDFVQKRERARNIYYAPKSDLEKDLLGARYSHLGPRRLHKQIQLTNLLLSKLRVSRVSGPIPKKMSEMAMQASHDIEEYFYRKTPGKEISKSTVDVTSPPQQIYRTIFKQHQRKINQFASLGESYWAIQTNQAPREEGGW